MKVYIFCTIESSTDNTNNDDSTSVLLVSVIVSVIVVVTILILIIVCITCIITYKRKSMKLDLRFGMRDYYNHFYVHLSCSQPADDVNVAPNIGYGLVNIAKASVTRYIVINALKDGLTQTFNHRNEDEAYERIDDCLYEQINDKPVQDQQENTPVVGGSSGDKAITSCPAYETTTTSFTATGMTIHS